MATFKDKATNVCGLLISLSTVVATFAVTMNLPSQVVAICGLVAGLSTAFLGYLSGKDANGKPKVYPPPDKETIPKNQ